MRYLLTLFLILSACAIDPKDPRDLSGIDPAFVSLVKKFEGLLGHSIGDIPIGFSDDPSYAGQCLRWTGAGYYREIKIYRGFWNGANDYQRENALFHELGHCALNRKHDEETIYWKAGLYVPKSFMWPGVFFNNELEPLTSYYENELFNP